MTSTPSTMLFIVCAIFAIFGAVATVMAKKTLRAAMGLLLNIVALGGMYLTLHAELLAALQLLVYAGAVVVLFVFVIMLIGPTATTDTGGKALAERFFGALFMGIVTLMLASALVRVSAPLVGVPEEFGSVEGLGMALYQGAALPFELVSATLVVAIIGAIAVARGRTPKEAAELKAHRAEKEAEAAARSAQSQQAEG